MIPPLQPRTCGGCDPRRASAVGAGCPGLSGTVRSLVQLGWDNGPTATPGVLLKGQSTRRGAWREGKAQHCRWGSATKAALPRARSCPGHRFGEGWCPPSCRKAPKLWPSKTHRASGSPGHSTRPPKGLPSGGITPLTHQSLGTPSPAATAPALRCLSDAHTWHRPSLPQDAVPGLLGVPWISPGCPQLWHVWTNPYKILCGTARAPASPCPAQASSECLVAPQIPFPVTGAEPWTNTGHPQTPLTPWGRAMPRVGQHLMSHSPAPTQQHPQHPVQDFGLGSSWYGLCGSLCAPRALHPHQGGARALRAAPKPTRVLQQEEL